VVGLPAADRISAHNQHACAVLAHACPQTGGPVMCWGNGGDGQLGNGRTSTSSKAVSVLAP
jgi:hypothetical protein